MKYTSILAGFFGLMALAACTNNDEVVVEQTKGLHTITVAYGRGANTRLAIEEKWDDYDMLSFKSSWENTDQIKLVAEDETEYVYSIETINAETTLISTIPTTSIGRSYTVHSVYYPHSDAQVHPTQAGGSYHPAPQKECRYRSQDSSE